MKGVGCRVRGAGQTRGGPAFTRNRRPEFTEPRPEIRNSKPQTPAPKPQNSKPKTQNPRPKTQDPKPKTQNPKPKTQNSNPKPQTQGWYEVQKSDNHGNLVAVKVRVRLSGSGFWVPGLEIAGNICRVHLHVCHISIYKINRDG